MSENTPSTVAPPLSIPEAGTALRGHHWQCPRCGSTDLASGYLIDYSDKFRQLQLAPRALKLSRISRMLRPFSRLVNVGAQVCRHCGAVTLEVDPDEFAEAERKYGRR
jgi:RNA polymerase subunit RPABC4/transcription elongation factor Spt4